MHHITGFSRDEIVDLCVIINSAERTPSSLKWPPILGLFKSVTVTLAYFRHNRTQAEIGESFDVSQSTMVLSLAGGALTAHLDPSYRMGRPVIKNKAFRALLIAAAGCMAVIALVYGVFTYTDVNQLIGDLVLASRPRRRRRRPGVHPGSAPLGHLRGR